MPVIVVATITPKAGRSAELEQVFAAAIPKVHGEPGCELYALHRGEGGTLVMIEKWADRDALTTHSQGPAMAEIAAGLSDLVEGSSDLALLEAAPYGDSHKGAL